MLPVVRTGPLPVNSSAQTLRTLDSAPCSTSGRSLVGPAPSAKFFRRSVVRTQLVCRPAAQASEVVGSSAQRPPTSSGFDIPATITMSSASDLRIQVCIECGRICGDSRARGQLGEGVHRRATAGTPLCELLPPAATRKRGVLFFLSAFAASAPWNSSQSCNASTRVRCCR
jgi:hypothetical protein